jgi:hypothetical protein
MYARQRTSSSDQPLTQLRGLRAADGRALLAYRPPARRPRLRPERGTWEVRGTGYSFPGSPAGCPQLSTWGAATRAVLAAALQPLHREEDRLRAALGKSPRTTRPELPAPAHQTSPVTRNVDWGTALRVGQWDGAPLIFS